MSSMDTTLAGLRERSREDYDLGLRRHMLQVYNYMASGVLLSGLVALLCSESGVSEHLYGKNGSTLLGLVAIFAPLAYVFFLGKTLREGSLAKGQFVFWSFTALMGVSLSAVTLQYTGQSIATTFFATATAFAGLSLVGYTTRKDLTGIGQFLIMALWGLIAALVLNMVVGSEPMSYVLSAVGILIFAGLTVYDTQKIKLAYRRGISADANERMAIWGAVDLYLDFVNLFIHLLQFVGVKKN